jgi:hypothetical protein
MDLQMSSRELLEGSPTFQGVRLFCNDTVDPGFLFLY